MKFILSIILFSSFTSSQNPQQSIETFIDPFSEVKSFRPHLNTHLLEIAKNGQNLTPDKRTQLEALGFNFNRPLISRGGAKRSESDGLNKIYDSGMFRFHYTNSGFHSVNMTDINGNNISDYIESLAKIFNEVSTVLHDQMGYLKPPGDGYYESTRDKGGSAHYDVYVRNLSPRYYGYVQPEEYAQGKGDNEQSGSVLEVNAFTSYMAIRNNYQNFPLDEADNIKVTAAHEYFHAIQFGYDGWEKPWLLEASAVWMEEEIYDYINDCYQYMKNWFDYPHRSLDESGYHWYGSFIFFEYLEQHMGGNAIIRQIMEKSVKSNSRNKDGSHLAIHDALKQTGFSFQQALNGMAVANMVMSSLPSAGNFSYEEAEFYPVEGPAIFNVTNFQSGNRDTVESTNLARFGSQYVKIVSDKPVQVDLMNTSGSFSDLQLNAILKRNDESYLVISSPSINIDPTDLKSIHLSVVSQDSIGNNWDYKLIVKDGKPGTGSNVPKDFTLTNPYPNPFNGSVKLLIYILKESLVTVDVIDLSGRIVSRLHRGTLTSGNHQLSWNGKDEVGNAISSGVYYIKVVGPSTQEWRPVTFVK